MIGILWAEARDAAKYLTMHRTDPTIKHYPAQNVNRDNIEKTYSSSSAR